MTPPPLLIRKIPGTKNGTILGRLTWVEGFLFGDGMSRYLLFAWVEATGGFVNSSPVLKTSHASPWHSFPLPFSLSLHKPVCSQVLNPTYLNARVMPPLETAVPSAATIVHGIGSHHPLVMHGGRSCRNAEGIQPLQPIHNPYNLEA